jgi:single-strand DNA-binding protein
MPSRPSTPIQRLSENLTNRKHTMSSYNKVILVGNLTRDPELKYTPKGTAAAKVGMAVNRKWRTETGESKEEVTFVDIDMFGKTAENVAQYMRKGSSMLVEGRLRLDSWDDKQTGQKRSKLGVVAENVQFLGGKSDGAPAAPRSTAPPAGSPAASPDSLDDNLDRVPF